MYQETSLEENITISDRKQASRWSINARRRYCAGEMSQEEISEIEEGILGWSWDIRNQGAEDIALKKELLVRAQQGLTKPSSHSKDPENRRLGRALNNYTLPARHFYDAEFDKKIREIAPKWFLTGLDRVYQKKQKLIAMAKNNEPKPSKDSRSASREEKELGRALGNYMRVSSKMYDEGFVKKIIQINPNWITTPSSRSNKKKQELIKRAKKGLSKPMQSSKNKREKELGKALLSYTNKNNASYDADFDRKIRKLTPDWFITQADRATTVKKELLIRAEQKKTRPSCHAKYPKEKKLGAGLVNYICKTGDSYDADFDRKIRKLAPDWFITQADRARTVKKELLVRAKQKKTRPSSSAKNQKEKKLGIALCSYTNKSQCSYDVDFYKKICKLAPDWFVTQSERAAYIKHQLLAMAKKNMSKPSGCSKNAEEKELGLAFSRYTRESQSSYDVNFTNKIRKLRPDWFRTHFDKATQKKQTLLVMAKKNMSKPSECSKNAEEKELGWAFSRYTHESCGSYDATFTKQIRELRPGWLRK